MEHSVDLAAVESAHDRIREHIHRTPVLTSQTLERIAGRALFFKCENLQRVGAFKIRGAMNAIAQLDGAEAASGVVTHSSGNHAQALALAAKTRGIAAHIVMPTSAPPTKRDAVLGYGARVYDCEPTLAARTRTAEQLADRLGARVVPPSDDPAIIAGQGTVALEMLEQAPKAGVVVVPIGGGGLTAGVAIAVKSRCPNVRVVAAEPKLADDAARSKAAGRLIPAGDSSTIADGLRTGLGEHTWPVIRDLVDAVVTVEEAEIVAAMRLVWERMKLIIEPSAAVAVAAVLGDGLDAIEPLAPASVVLSGGNVQLNELPF